MAKKRNNLSPEEAFGAVLKQMRLNRGITQQDLSFDCELDRTFISLLERGKRQPTLTTILQIANALEIPATELIDETIKALG